MPTTRPRRLHLGGLEISVTLERTLAERIKGLAAYRLLRGTPPPAPFRDGEPVLNGARLEDIEWYHTIDLPNGVATPGFVDHRPQVPLYGLPDSLAGKRCLDVATFDGFWAFELEKRGAAEVIGIDLYSLADADHPTNFHEEYLHGRPNPVKGMGFAYAKRARGSRVRRKVLSVYELSPQRVGMFDFVFMSDLMIHLRQPDRALEALWTVLRPGGHAIIADAYDPILEEAGHPGVTRVRVTLDDYSGCYWWNPSTSALEGMVRMARFQDVKIVNRFVLDTRSGEKVHKIVFHARGGKEPIE